MASVSARLHKSNSWSRSAPVFHSSTGILSNPTALAGFTFEIDQTSSSRLNGSVEMGRIFWLMVSICSCNTAVSPVPSSCGKRSSLPFSRSSGESSEDFPRWERFFPLSCGITFHSNLRYCSLLTCLMASLICNSCCRWHAWFSSRSATVRLRCLLRVALPVLALSTAAIFCLTSTASNAARLFFACFSGRNYFAVACQHSV